MRIDAITETELPPRSERDEEAAFDAPAAYLSNGSGTIPSPRYSPSYVLPYPYLSPVTEKTDGLNLFFCFRYV